MIPIADLHCDLLVYLAEKGDINNPEARCSLPQLIEGNVKIQTLAIYTATGENPVVSAEKQRAIFCTLPQDKIQFIPAIENASGLCDESEKLENAFTRFDNFRKTLGPILYIGLTWHDENRFGGGNLSTAGLKADGERMLDYLDGKKIAIDLSHTSDALAHDILNYIDAKGLKITPIASHSNFRAVTEHARNLPDPLAKEVFRRGGVMGLNFVKDFIGQSFSAHVEHAKSLGGFDSYCFGADFFYSEDMPFFEEFSNASCYPKMLELLKEGEKMAYINFENFLARMHT